MHRFDEARATRVLNLDGIGLKAFPIEIAALSQLKVLSIMNNEIEVLPPVCMYICTYIYTCIHTYILVDYEQ